MNTEEQQYLDLLKKLIDAPPKDDRTGVGTHSIFGHMMRFSLEDGTLPLLTTKKVFFRGVVEELIMFLNGITNTKVLEDKGVGIWKGNTSREFLDNMGFYDYKEGEMGPLYSAQLRNFGGNMGEYYPGVDQLEYVFNEIKNNPSSRRIMFTYFNPKEVHLSVLYPCHVLYQFNVRDGKLDCMWTQRSCDTFLGFSFNLASASLLVHILAKATGLKTGDIIFSGGDVHLYKSHIEQAKEQISREPYLFPKIKINREINSIKDIEVLKFEDFELIDYKFHPAIRAEMAI